MCLFRSHFQPRHCGKPDFRNTQFNVIAQFKWVFCVHTGHAKRLYGNPTARNGTDDLCLDVILLCPQYGR